MIYRPDPLSRRTCLVEMVADVLVAADLDHLDPAELLTEAQRQAEARLREHRPAATVERFSSHQLTGGT